MPDSLPSSPSDSPPRRRLSTKERMEAFIEEYGKLGIIVVASLSLLSLVGVMVALYTGMQPTSATGFFGILAAAWAINRPFMPVRLALALVLTPFIARVIKYKKRGGSSAA